VSTILGEKTSMLLPRNLRNRSSKKNHPSQQIQATPQSLRMDHHDANPTKAIPTLTSELDIAFQDQICRFVGRTEYAEKSNERESGLRENRKEGMEPIMRMAMAPLETRTRPMRFVLEWYRKVHSIFPAAGKLTL